MRIGKLGAVALVIGVPVLMLGNSTHRTVYECAGVVAKAPIKVFIRITLNRSWVFWRQERGIAGVEIPRTNASAIKGVFMLSGPGAYLNLHPWPGAGEVVDTTKPATGQFSTISNSLELSLSDTDVFRGSCAPKER